MTNYAKVNTLPQTWIQPMNLLKPSMIIHPTTTTIINFSCLIWIPIVRFLPSQKSLSQASFASSQKPSSDAQDSLL